MREGRKEPLAFPIVYKYKDIIKEGTYRPDFFLVESTMFWKVKGWWRDDAKIKFEAFIEQYPKINIRLMMLKELQNEGINIKR